MEKLFKIKESGSTISTEIMAGFTTFFTMVYIIFVNPTMLAESGIPWGGVFIATILASIIGTLIMGLYANVPYAQAPGMGLNAFFTYVVCGSMGFAWQEALVLVFICGLINIFITITSVRKEIIASIPSYIQNAIGGAIGIFIAYIGLKNAGFLSFTINPEQYIQFDTGTIIANGSLVPELASFNNPAAIVALIVLAITIILLVLKVKGAIFFGILSGGILSFLFGTLKLDGIKIFDIAAIGEIKETAFVIFSKAGFPSLLANPEKIFLAIITVFAFSLSDTFDTIGTFIGTGKVSGIFNEEDINSIGEKKGLNSKMEKALMADAVATSIGAVLGTSNVTTFVESAAGIGAGGRTGLTSIVVAFLFFACIPFSNLIGRIPPEVTAPALIVVGIMMSASFKGINWDDMEEAVPAFMTIIVTAFAYNISYGIAAGFIFHCIIKICKKETKQLHPILVVATILFIINFIVLALLGRFTAL